MDIYPMYDPPDLSLRDVYMLLPVVHKYENSFCHVRI
jgi:hypothetical protein